MDDERIVIAEESNPQKYPKLVASGDVDGTTLEAFEHYAKRQERPLGSASAQASAQVPFMITTAQKQRLREMGYDDEAIRSMTPETAHKLLSILPPPY
jgi:hypothetical protein